MNHHLKRFQRIFPLRRLSWQHYRICSVIYSIGNICNFRSCRTRITHHRVQHLGCRNNCFKVHITFLNNHFLKIRNFFCRNFYSKISSRNHNPVCSTDNFINIFNSFCILYFCNNRNIWRTEFFKVCFYFKYTFCISHKRCSDKINSLLYSKTDIILIFFCDCRKSNRYIRHIYSLSLTEFSSVYDFAENFLFTFSNNF